MLKIKTYIDTILSWNNMHFQWPHFINLFFCCCWYFEFIFVECWHEKPFHAIQKLARYSIHYFYCCCPSAELYPINKINWKLPNRLTIKMAKFNCRFIRSYWWQWTTCFEKYGIVNQTSQSINTPPQNQIGHVERRRAQTYIFREYMQWLKEWVTNVRNYTRIQINIKTLQAEKYEKQWK